VFSLRWNDYVHEGIWAWRNEDISEPAMPENAKPGRTWFAAHVGITRSRPIEVRMPEVILDPLLATSQQHPMDSGPAGFTGSLTGRLVFDGVPPRRNVLSVNKTYLISVAKCSMTNR